MHSWIASTRSPPLSSCTPPAEWKRSKLWIRTPARTERGKLISGQRLTWSNKNTPNNHCPLDMDVFYTDISFHSYYDLYESVVQDSVIFLLAILLSAKLFILADMQMHTRERKRVLYRLLQSMSTRSNMLTLLYWWCSIFTFALSKADCFA